MMFQEIDLYAINSAIKELTTLTLTSYQEQSDIKKKLLFIKQDLIRYQTMTKENNHFQKDIEAYIQEQTRLKEQLIANHHEMLQHLEILAYQNDIKAIIHKIGYYQAFRLDEYTTEINMKDIQIISSGSSFHQDSKTNSPTNQINQAFCLQNSQSLMLDQYDSQIQSALNLINNTDISFESKQQVWLDIVYHPKSQVQNQEVQVLHHVTTQEIIQHHQQYIQSNLSEFSEISQTQQYDPCISVENQSQRYLSGKKIKSMIVLKEKSTKKKSMPKTSIKKKAQSKEVENVQQESERFKKRIIFPSKQKERYQKVIENKEVWSKRKALNSHRFSILDSNNSKSIKTTVKKTMLNGY